MSTTEYANPLVPCRADPWVLKYRHDYYFTASVPEYDRLEIRRATTLAGLDSAEPVVVWRKPDTGSLSANIWAPELHRIGDVWVIYFAAAHTSETDEGLFDHRMYALVCHDSDPMLGEWAAPVQVRSNWESFCLDATAFEHEGQHYYVWAQRDPDIAGNSNLYIAPLENAWTLGQPQVRIAVPEYDWEIIGFLVNEGPAVIRRHGRIFITYSASATDHHYCMGLLYADENADLLDSASWTKHPEPVFQSSATQGQFGPGHNSFTVSEDGKEDVLVYHARNYKEIDGDPLYDPNRHTRAQVFKWSDNGFPVFGEPVADDAKRGARANR